MLFDFPNSGILETIFISQSAMDSFLINVRPESSIVSIFYLKEEKKTKRILYPLSEPLFHIKLYIDYRLCAKSLRVAEVIEDIKTTNTQPTFHI